MKNHEQGHDTAKRQEMQVVMPLNIGMQIPAAEPVRVLMEVTERLDYGKLRRTYQRPTRKDEATAKQLFQLTVLGFMHG